MIRQFKLTNAINQIVSLNDLNSFGHDPDGLGVSFSNSFYNTNANFIVDSSEVNQNHFKINVAFGALNRKSYEGFNQFIQFLNFPPFTLTYVTNAGTFRRDCILNELTKKELNDFNILDEELTLDFTTPFYRYITGSNSKYLSSSGKSKVYENVNLGNNEGFYTHKFAYGVNNTGRSGFFAINNQSVYLGSAVGSPFEITIYGEVENPSWELYQGSQLIQSDGYFLNVPKDYKLVVSSFPQQQRAQLVAPTGDTQNVYQYQDLTKTNFITIPIGEYTLILKNMQDAKEVNWRMREERIVV